VKRSRVPRSPSRVECSWLCWRAQSSSKARKFSPEPAHRRSNQSAVVQDYVGLRARSAGVQLQETMARSRSKSPKRGGATSPAARRRKTPQAADVQVVDTAMLEGIKCAVIGACGFLGSAIVKQLTQTRVHAVVAIDVVDPVDPVCDDDDHRVSYVTPPMDTTTPSLSHLLSSFLGFYSTDFQHSFSSWCHWPREKSSTPCTPPDHFVLASATGQEQPPHAHHLITSCEPVPLAKSSHPMHTT
jgi:hypothetical protein